MYQLTPKTGETEKPEPTTYHLPPTTYHLLPTPSEDVGEGIDSIQLFVTYSYLLKTNRPVKSDF